MPIDIRIEENALTGFSGQAKDHLKSAVRDYSTELIDEANRIEAGRNAVGGTPEVTQSMVSDAVVLIRRGLRVHKSAMGIRVLRVLSAVLSLLVGILYNESKLQNGAYMSLFIFVVAGAILSVTIAAIKE